MSLPNIEIPDSVDVKHVKKQHISGEGKPIVDPWQNIGHEVFTLKWKDMSQDDLDLLEVAVEEDLGTDFIWKNFYTQRTHWVCYAENGFEYDMSEDLVSGHYSVTLKLISISTDTITTTTTTT